MSRPLSLNDYSWLFGEKTFSERLLGWQSLRLVSVLLLLISNVFLSFAQNQNSNEILDIQTFRFRDGLDVGFIHDFTWQSLRTAKPACRRAGATHLPLSKGRSRKPYEKCNIQICVLTVTHKKEKAFTQLERERIQLIFYQKRKFLATHLKSRVFCVFLLRLINLVKNRKGPSTFAEGPFLF